MLDKIIAERVINASKGLHSSILPAKCEVRDLMAYHALCKERLRAFVYGCSSETEFEGSPEEIMEARNRLQSYARKLEARRLL